MNNQIVIAEAMNGNVRIHAVDSTDIVQEATTLHHCLATSAAALGRTLTVTSIMGSDLKNANEKVTCIFNGHGPAGTVLAQADGSGNVKGFIGDPSIYLVRSDGHLDVGKAIGTNGTLTVTRDMGLKEPFTGMVNIRTGEVGDDFAYYYAVSEQTPSVVNVGVLVNPDGSILAAGGLIMQLFPNASEDVVEACELLARKMRPMSTMISEGHTVEDIIHEYFEDANILEHKDVRWYCGCTHDHYKEALSTLADHDLQEMFDDGKGAEIHCQYCNKEYHFSPDELKEVLETKKRD
ncbi:MAG: Hsp33 family molecular chaperone HslO [Erysipelotrichaceae bacterium]|nr:Hsp33 family molecular chaperone HslO [Erysipelotrichaceae bacterium]MDY6034277.1 Hsp33 family molecular chaperone HslO [Bulleidia sp.]